MSDTSLPVYYHYGTAAERGAFTPDPPATGQPIYIWYETDTGITYLYYTSWVAITTGGSLVNPWSQIITGRLTTESGVPVSTSDRTAQGTIYFTPAINGNAITNGQIALYSGSAVINQSFTQLSLALTATSGKNYDVFVDYNSGTPQLVLSAAWTNDTTRADALAVQSGLIVKSGTATYRWVGTIRASGANVTSDSAANRFVWNAYNQVARLMRNATETTDTWAYTTAAFRQANANAANQLDYVTGDASSLIVADVHASASNSSSALSAVGVGIDSTTTNSAQLMVSPADSGLIPVLASYKGYPGLGRHVIAWLETGEGVGTTTWRGDGGAPTRIQSGISGTIWN